MGSLNGNLTLTSLCGCVALQTTQPPESSHADLALHSLLPVIPHHSVQQLIKQNMSGLVSNEMDVPVVLGVTEDVECDVDIAGGVISSRRLGDAFDFHSVLCAPLMAARLWPTGPSILVCFMSLTDLVHSFLYLSVATLIGIASEHGVPSFSQRWCKAQFVHDLCCHECSAPCVMKLVFVFNQQRWARGVCRDIGVTTPPTTVTSF